MECPAVAIEMAPERDADEKMTAEPDNADYQAKRGGDLATALLAWRDGGSPAMIPRYLKIIFVVLLLAALAMAGVFGTWREDHERMLEGQDSAPTKAPEVAPPSRRRCWWRMMPTIPCCRRR